MVRHKRLALAITMRSRGIANPCGRLGDYQILRYTAVERYLHLVLIAYDLLTHLSMDRSGAKVIPQGRDAVRLLSVEKAQSLLREKLFEDSVNGY